MRIFNQISVFTVASVTLGWLTMAQANAASFTFTKIADTQSDFTSLENGIALNDSGVVSFVGTKPTTRGVFTGNGSAIAIIIDATNLPSLFPPGLPPGPVYYPGAYPPNTYSLGNSTAINNQGSVLFTATDSNQTTPGTQAPPTSISDQGLFKSRNGSTSTVGKVSSFRVSGPGVTRSYDSFDINDSDQILTSITQHVDSPHSASWTTIAIDGKAVAQGSTGPYQPTETVYGQAINNQGTVFYAESGTNLGGFNINNLYTFNNGVATAVFDRPFDVKTLAANDSSAVFSGTFSSNINGTGTGESGIFQVENGVAKRIFNGTADSIDINNQGIVAFDANNKISILSNGVSEQIIGIGDSLLGSTVKSVFFPSSKSLNNAGQLAFYAQLADGTKAIFRADPISTKVPEPTAILGLVAIAGLGISSRRRYRRS